MPARGVTKRGTIPREPIHYGGAESLRGRRITDGGAEKSQQCHKYFLQYSKFAFKRSQAYHRGAKLRPWGRRFDQGGAEFVFCPGRHLTSLRPWCQQHFETNAQFLFNLILSTWNSSINLGDWVNQDRISDILCYASHAILKLE